MKWVKPSENTFFRLVNESTVSGTWLCKDFLTCQRAKHNMCAHALRHNLDFYNDNSIWVHNDPYENNVKTIMLKGKCSGCNKCVELDLGI